MRRRLLWLAVLSMLLVLGCSSAFAQEGGGFTATFDDSSLEGWEHGQDATVQDGVLRLAQENPAFRIGSWSVGSLRVRARFTGGEGVGIIHYDASDQGSYDLRVAPDEWVLERVREGQPTVLAAGSAEGVDLTDWVDIEVTVAGAEHRVTAASREVLTASDEDRLPPGAIGFILASGGFWELDTVELEPTLEGTPAPVVGGNEVPAGADQATETSVAEAETSGGALADFFSGQANPTEIRTFAINLALAAVCSFVLGLVYVFWGSSLSNRRKFAANFIFITVTTTFIILVVRSSVALSLGLVGALSITRFRHAIKEPEELAYLFVAIGIGIGLGDNQRLITLLTLVAIIIVAGVMRVARRSQADVNLHLNIALPAEKRVDLTEVMHLLKRYCSKVKLLRFDESSEVTELSFVIEFRRTSDLNSVRNDLKQFSPAAQISFLDNRGIW